MVVITLALLATACGSDKPSQANSSQATASIAAEDPVAAAQERVTTAESGVTTAQDALTSANSDFCSATTDYVKAIDRYGKIFNTKAATVGDIKTAGTDLTEPKDTVTSAATGVQDARTALAAAQQEDYEQYRNRHSEQPCQYVADLAFLAAHPARFLF